ncbi:solute carrier family 35 member F2-like isoform X3 [Brienomyrus brachyistius]|uniref:solute carrier family 35 member F2-like isoform X3 n=1 Tax=Brienomyrus brachyistius TaxID=42636 RepID=UPI0020B38702|nr:solute carrier family 35 member F2-like isoform X3 [Brienomyrus brachyistius]
MTPEELAPTDPENGDGGRDVLGNRCWIQELRKVLTWRLLKTTAMGQMLSAMICGSAICSQYLATDFHVNAPMLQNFIYYALLFLTYSTILACRKASDILLGDGLVLLSALMYAVTNLGQEFSVKHGSLLDFPGMMGLFGILISGIQCAALEQKDITAIRWNWRIGLLFAAYALCLFLLYSLMPLVIRLTSATTVNLSLLTSDIFSFFFGVFLFHYTFSGLYIVSFVAILVGFVMFNATTLASTAPVSPAKRDEVQGVIDGPVPGPEVKDGPDGQVLFQDQAGAAEQEVIRSTKM